LNKLATEGLVEIRPGSGTYVRAVPQEDSNRAIANARPLELIDARFALEPHICRLAVLHARLDDFDHAEELLNLMDESRKDPVAFATADTEFHIVLAEATGNPLLIWIIKQISQVRNLDQWAQMRYLTLNDKMIANYNLQHRNILNAIKTREPERAASQMKEHLETARLSLTRAVAT
jgi:DNA-binding FadR family transcriptional regulator